MQVITKDKKIIQVGVQFHWLNMILDTVKATLVVKNQCYNSPVIPETVYPLYNSPLILAISKPVQQAAVNTSPHLSSHSTVHA